MEHFTIEDIKEISALSLADAEDLLSVVNLHIQAVRASENETNSHNCACARSGYYDYIAHGVMPAHNRTRVELAYLEDKKYFLEKRMTEILDKQLEDYHKQPNKWNKRDSCDKLRQILDAALIRIPLDDLLKVLNYSLARIPEDLKINVFFDFAAMMEFNGYVCRTQSYDAIATMRNEGYFDSQLP
jgi:hypothetical protein